MQGLQERNERLFHRVLLENLEELLPVVYNPTVRLGCQKYGLMFKSLPRGLFITLEDRGRVFRILKNWPERNVKLLVVSDGERVGDLGDLGVQVGR
jgi:malate dehydrogenase (oxaloacetate-decarboxylating)(NADP+)